MKRSSASPQRHLCERRKPIPISQSTRRQEMAGFEVQLLMQTHGHRFIERCCQSLNAICTTGWFYLTNSIYVVVKYTDSIRQAGDLCYRTSPDEAETHDRQ